MTFPVVESEIGLATFTYGVSVHVITLPAGIVADDLLLLFFTVDLAPTITWPAGWTVLFEDMMTLGQNAAITGCCYRRADGLEGPTITVSLSLEKWCSWQVLRISGAAYVPECGISTDEIGTTANPPLLTPTWGAKDTLWLAVLGNDGNRTCTDYPDDYTDGLHYVHASPSSVGIGTCRREINAVSQDPNTFTISQADQTLGNTVAIEPAPPPPPPPLGIQGTSPAVYRIASGMM